MENKELTLARIGMNRDANPAFLSEHEYTFALNTINESEDGNSPNLQNEPSNILCSDFPFGFKVIGVKTDLVSNRTYFFLVNPTTGTSQIGYISGLHTVATLADTETECNCNVSEILATPLEDQDPVATCIYYPLTVDGCNKCLNFDMRYPIHSIEIYGGKLYWTDDYNPPRTLDTNDLEQYKLYSDADCDPIYQCNADPLCEGCQDCENNCPNCEKMLVFKNFEKPCLEPETIIYGGNLKQGTYSFLAA